MSDIVVVPSKMSPGSFKDYSQRIKASEKLGKFYKCLKLCIEALGVAPLKQELVLMKAKFLVLTNQFDKAKKVLDNIPMSAERIFIRGLIFYQRGKFNRSVNYFKRAWKLDSTKSHVVLMESKAIRLKRLQHQSEKVETLLVK